ncbi:chalcone isomerase family protein [Ideonella livida]|uniref:Chalcone isomerase domain-containing protein n=1 Tax=Ideonella livida TaxID=2707176 RepID=A0A7C9PEL6_9BURK|nr:chalcone isomerase family protein [Ideonella livida]NDY89835.1 hypothetical protein [Ideonella livida]
MIVQPHTSLATRRWLAACTLALASAAVQAAPTTTRFEPTTQVQGQALLLNGTGTRVRAVFKVYDMALYTTRKVSTTQDLLNLGGAKKLHFAALRELPGTDLGLLFLKGLQANSTKEQVQKHTTSSTRLIEIFSGKNKLMPGDTFTMEFIPDKGTQFYIQEQAQGGPVGDAEFFEMILKIWFGPASVDTGLRDALLGQR